MLHAIFISILESYKKASDNVPYEIKLLLGIEQNKTDSTNFNKNSSSSTACSLSKVINYTISNDNNPLINRWVVAIAVSTKTNNLELIASKNDLITIYISEPEFNKEIPNISSSGIKYKGKYYIKANKNLIAVTFMQSDHNKNLFFGYFLLSPSKAREISYAICEEISHLNFVRSMSAAFCDHKTLSSDSNILYLKNSLENSVQVNSRWQLIPASSLY